MSSVKVMRRESQFFAMSQFQIELKTNLFNKTLVFSMVLNCIQLQPERKRTDVIHREERKSY